MKRTALGIAIAAAALLGPSHTAAQSAPGKPSILIATFYGGTLPSDVFGYDVESRLESLLMGRDAYQVVSIERLHGMLPVGIAAQYPDRRQPGHTLSSCVRSRQAASVAAVTFVLCANVRALEGTAYEVSATLYTARDTTQRALAAAQGRDAESVAAELLIQLLRR